MLVECPDCHSKHDRDRPCRYCASRAEFRARDARKAQLSRAERCLDELPYALSIMLAGIGALILTLLIGLSGPSLEVLRWMPYVQLVGYGLVGLGLWLARAGLKKAAP